PRARHAAAFLADPKLDRVAGPPEPVDLPVLRVRLRGERAMAPLGRRQESSVLGAYVEAGLVADAEACCPRLQRMAHARGRVVEVVADLVEPRVARGADCGRQRHRL